MNIATFTGVVVCLLSVTFMAGGGHTSVFVEGKNSVLTAVHRSQPLPSFRGSRRPAKTDTDRRAAERLSAEGDRLRDGRYPTAGRMAINKYLQSLTRWRAISDKRGESYALQQIGELYQRLWQPEKALEYFNRALRTGREAGDRKLESEILNRFGTVYIHLGNPQKAIEYCSKALKLGQDNGDAAAEAHSLSNIGHAYYAMGDRKEALSHYQKALPLWRLQKSLTGEAQALLDCGQVHSDSNDTDRAIKFFDQSLSLWRAADDKRGEASTLRAIGNLYSRIGKKQAALEHYEKARRLLHFVGDRIEEARMLNGLAYIYRELGGVDVALDYYNQALELFKATKYRRGVAGSLIVIGGINYSKGEYKAALACFKQALVRAREQKDKHYESYALRGIAAVNDSLGNRKIAIDYYREALALHEELGDKRAKAYAIDGLGRIYDSLGETKTALSMFSQALALSSETADRFGEVSTLFNIAAIERAQGDLTSARGHIESANRIIESLRSDVAGRELRASFLATVRRNFELNIDLLMLMHKQSESDRLDSKAFSTSERGRARSLIEMLAEARADIRQGADATLLERERTLQRMVSAKAEQYSALLARPHKAEQATLAAKEVDAATLELQRVQSQIRATSPRYASLTQPQPLTVEVIQEQLLDSNTLLLEYALGEERSYLWAVTRDSLTSFELPKRATVEAAARRVYELLTAQNFVVQGETAQQKNKRVARAEVEYANAATILSQMVIGPAASKLADKRLVIVADGALQYVPFGALPKPIAKEGAAGFQTSDNGPGRGADSQPLIVHHEIVSLPSASTLAVIRREVAGRERALKSVAVFADPVFSRLDPRVGSSRNSAPSAENRGSALRDFERAVSGFRVGKNNGEVTRLPFSRREAEAIRAAAGEDQILEAIGFDASREAAMSDQLRNYRIIHFATHGLLNSERPELSGMIFSMVDREGKLRNGFLRLHDVYNLNLPAELIVLSACQTGLGKDIKGEGLVGLTRGFMYAGAARVMASLWQVDDAATAELMKRFYAKMLGDGLRPAAALRDAQVEMWKHKTWQSPYYWAGFMLQGEWR